MSHMEPAAINADQTASMASSACEWIALGGTVAAATSWRGPLWSKSVA